MAATNKYIDYINILKEKHVGSKINKLTILDVYKKSKYYVLMCICDCGNKHSQSISQILSGKSTRCKKCSSIYMNKDRGTYRGDNSSEYNAWRAMKSRCNNKKNKHYNRYGGRGITFCDRWECFNSFLKDMGLSNGLTLDRINNDGNYEPNNCRWATRKEQSLNRSTNIFLTAFGDTMTVSEWSIKLGVNRKNILYRYHKGFDHEKCLVK